MLVDTNLLVRTLQPHHPLFPIASGALSALRYGGHRLYLVPQNLIELWTVLTRPLEANGLGLSTHGASSEVERMERFFVVLPEAAAIYPMWKRLVTDHQISGKPAHDARLVAAMQVHGIDSILTFDQSGFSRYSGIEVINPADVVRIV